MLVEGSAFAPLPIKWLGKKALKCCLKTRQVIFNVFYAFQELNYVYLVSVCPDHPYQCFFKQSTYGEEKTDSVRSSRWLVWHKYFGLFFFFNSAIFFALIMCLDWAEFDIIIFVCVINRIWPEKQTAFERNLFRQVMSCRLQLKYHPIHSSSFLPLYPHSWFPC